MPAQPEERVLIAYMGEDSAEQSTSGRPQVLDSFVLCEPKTGLPQGVMLTEADQLLEVQQYKQMFSSWFTNERLVADGSLYLCTPMDPLFPLLPILEKARNKAADNDGVFCALDQILAEAGAHRQGAERLARAATCADLRCLCDVKEAGGDSYFRLNDKKALAWLICKVQQARQSLSYQLSSMEAPAQTAYVVSFLSEYLPERWVTMLAQQLDIEAELKGNRPLPLSGHEGTQQQPEKRQKIDPKEAARQAARKKTEEARQQTKAQQAAGTKKISSFFAPRVKN